jgi:putative colanic acid biosysnthesis UDP-glucose lipid carrier transferase
MILGNRILILLFFATDLVLLCFSIALVSKLQGNQWPPTSIFYLLCASWAIAYLVFIDFNFFEVQNIITRTKKLTRKILVFISLASLAIVVLEFDHISASLFLGSVFIFIILQYPASYLYTYLISIRRDGPRNKKVIVVGAGKIGEAIQKYYAMNPGLGMLLGFLDDRKRNGAERYTILGKTSDFQKIFDKTRFHEVIITYDLSREEEIKSMVNIAEYNGVRPSVVANYYSLFNRNFELKSFSGIPIVCIREVPLDSYIARFWKRNFDVVFSIFALILTTPILLVTAIAIKLESQGPVFYKPVRIGKNGGRFYVYKFRSMWHTNDHADGARSTTVDDVRITRVGKIMRKYSLDEVPQFINVLKGEMSVVGPRPHRVDLDKRFQQMAQYYMVRQYIKPGITGWAQVNGWRGPTETKYQYKARTLHDLWYIEHWNFPLDIYIILLTLFGKKTRRNVF